MPLKFTSGGDKQRKKIVSSSTDLDSKTRIHRKSLKSIPETKLSEFDLAVIQVVVPQDHYLRKVMACIAFEGFRPRLIGSYDADFGRPAIDPVRMLKILFLRFQDRLSDRQVMERTVTDMALHWFLTLSVHAEIPNYTNRSLAAMS